MFRTMLGMYTDLGECLHSWSSGHFKMVLVELSTLKTRFLFRIIKDIVQVHRLRPKSPKSPQLNYRVSQKKGARKQLTKFISCCMVKQFEQNSLVYIILLPHLHIISKTGMIFIRQFSRYDFKRKLTRRTIFVFFLLNG